MKKIAFTIVTLLIISCGKNTKQEFSLTGITTGFKNGSTLYLKIGKLIDSTKIENNTFIFNTKLDNDTSVKVVLHDKKYSNYRFFWAENKPMTFDATKTNFKNAKITGSETENLNFSLRQETENLSGKKRTKAEIEFIKNNPNSIVSASLLSVYSTTWGKEKVKELYKLLSTENKNSEFGKSIKEYLKLNKNPKIGDHFVDFTSKDPNGNLKKLSDLKGKVILLEFWSSFCIPCRKENPNLVKTYKKFNPKGLEIFAVSSDKSKKNWINAIKKDGLNWHHVSDLKGDKAEAITIYGIYQYPSNFLIDRNGKIIEKDLRGDKLNEKLNTIFK